MENHINLKHIPLSSLHISQMNMRVKSKNKDLSDILPSIREKGVKVPLIVRKETIENVETKYGIVAGSRRYTSQIIIKEELKISEPDTVYDPSMPCIEIDAENDIDAIEISLIENFARKAASPMTEYRTFVNLVKCGQSIDKICSTFGITSKEVKQRLALGRLINPIQRLIENGEIDNGTAQALTLASKTKQKEWLKLFKSKDLYAPTGRNLKAWLSGGEVISTANALFDLSEYKGKILEDLFGENAQFECKDTFWEAQNKAIAKKVEEYKSKGWKDVQLIDGYFCEWNHQKTKKSDGGRIYIEIGKSGEVKFHIGYVTCKEAEAIERQKLKQDSSEIDANETSAQVKPEMSGPLLNYFDLHRHSIAKLALTKRKDISSRLLLSMLICSSQTLSTQMPNRKGIKEEIQISADASKSEFLLQKQRNELAKTLGLENGITCLLRSWSTHTSSLETIFAKLLTLTDKDIEKITIFITAELLPIGNSVTELVGVLTQADTSKYWEPDEVFFDNLRDKNIINSMLEEIADKETAVANQNLTGKAQKNHIKDYYSGNNHDKAMDDWRPKWMSFPSTFYRNKDSVQYVKRWSALKADFSKFIK